MLKICLPLKQQQKNKKTQPTCPPLPKGILSNRNVQNYVRILCAVK